MRPLLRRALALALPLALSGRPAAAFDLDRAYVGGMTGAALRVDNHISQLKLVETVGLPLSPGPAGPYAQLDLHQGFGGGLFTFQISPRAGWGLPLIPSSTDVDLLVAPNVALGLAMGGRTTSLALQPALDLHLWLGDDLGLMLRPLAFDIWASRFLAVRADLLVGAVKRF
jgi:hypothetical protein